MTDTVTFSQPAPIRAGAQLLSYLLHPLFVPGVVAWWLLFQHPIYTLILEEPSRIRYFAMILLNTILFPGLTVFLLWRLKFISNVHLETQRERIIPLVISIVFYFWAWYVSKNSPDIPPAIRQWLVGIFICSCAAMFTNIYMKVSLHTLAMGGLVMFCLSMQITDPYWPNWLLPWALIIAGITGTARLLLNAHEPGEIYAGYLAGIICQIAAWVVM